MQNVLRILNLIVRIAVGALAGLLIIYNAYMLISRYILKEEIPTIFGFGFAVVASGSMEPALHVNDLIVTKAEDAYAVGDIVMFYDDADGIYITHRIVAVAAAGYTTKGDANSGTDGIVAPGDIVGKTVAVWEGAGAAIKFLQSPGGFFAVLGGGAVLWLATELLSGIRKDDKQKGADRDEKRKN